MTYAAARQMVFSALLLSLAGCASLPTGNESITFYDSAARMPPGCKLLGPVSAFDTHLYVAPARFVPQELSSNASKRYGRLTDTILVLSSTSATIGTVEATGYAYSCKTGRS